MKNKIISIFIFILAGIFSGCEVEEILITNKSIDAGSPYTFKNKDENTDNYNYIWNFGDGETSSEINPDHTYQTPGVYTVYVSRYKKNGKFISKDVFYVILVKKIFSPSIHKIEISTDYFRLNHFYKNIELNFDIFLSEDQKAVKNKYTFETRLQDGTIFTEQYNNYHIFDSVGYQTIQFTLTDENGISGTLDTTIYIGDDSTDIYLEIADPKTDSLGEIHEEYILIYNDDFYLQRDLELILDYNSDSIPLLVDNKIIYHEWFGSWRRELNTDHILPLQLVKPNLIHIKLPAYTHPLSDYSDEYTNKNIVLVRVGSQGIAVSYGELELTPGKENFFESSIQFIKYTE